MIPTPTPTKKSNRENLPRVETAKKAVVVVQHGHGEGLGFCYKVGPVRAPTCWAMERPAMDWLAGSGGSALAHN